MKTIKAQKITTEAYAPFGTFYDMEHPSSYALCGELHSFYPDRMTESYTSRVGISPMTVKKPEKMMITSAEYHTTTPEIIYPMNDDMIIHVAPASGGVPITDQTKAFIVPKGTMVKINTAIWHLAPLPVHEDILQVMIVLPECTYANDCTVVEFSEEQQFQIIL